jgi:nucleoside-diphosphate-sugar epimerase
MRVLVAGPIGAVGRNLLPRLVAAGHEVVGTTRSEEKAGVIRRLGGASDLRNFDRTFALTNRLRTEGTDYLLSGARELGVKRFIAQSFCGWPYAKVGGTVKSEEDPPDTRPARQSRRSLEAIRHVETAVTQATGMGGVVVRYGVFYRPGTGMFEDAFVEQIVRRRVPLVGGGTGWWSFVDVEDAAIATVLAIDPRPGREHLQYRRRRTGTGARVGAAARRDARGEAAAASTGLVVLNGPEFEHSPANQTDRSAVVLSIALIKK